MRLRPGKRIRLYLSGHLIRYKLRGLTAEGGNYLGSGEGRITEINIQVSFMVIDCTQCIDNKFEIGRVLEYKD